MIRLIALLAVMLAGLSACAPPPYERPHPLTEKDIDDMVRSL